MPYTRSYVGSGVLAGVAGVGVGTGTGGRGGGGGGGGGGRWW